MTTKHSQHRSRPTDRDRLILDHTARFRLTTLEVLSRVVLPGVSRNALNKVANRLVGLGFLQKYTLLHPRRYFVLGALGARTLGVGIHRATPLGPQSLPLEYALLIFATLGKKPHLRLTCTEVRQRCPWLPIALSSAPHCIDAAGVLELVRVDLGGPADHVARKCALDLAKRRRLPEFPRFVATGRMRLVVITATKGKATMIQRALDHHDWPGGLLIHFSIVPQLLSLTANSNHA